MIRMNANEEQKSQLKQVASSDSESDDPEAEIYKNLTEDQVMRARKYNECFICQKRFNSFAKFRAHVFSHNATTYKCEKCFKEFATIKYLNAHLTTHNENRKFTCDICSHIFGAKPYKCDVCDKAFSESSTRRKHRFSHFPNNPFRKTRDLYTCEICGKIVSKRHEKAHIGKKLFYCPICSKPFATMNLLDSHSLVHTSQLDEDLDGMR